MQVINRHVDSATAPPKTDDVLRIVTWNVAMSLDKKFEMLEALEPDIAVIPESANEARLMKAGVDGFSSSAWIGRNPSKGLLVLGFGEWKVKMLHGLWDQRLEWVLPVEVVGPIDFNMLAVWSFNERSTVSYPSELADQPTGHLLEVYEELLAGPCVISGDFNNHVRWDKGNPKRDFAELVRRYDEHGFTSAWHDHTGVAHGDPAEPATHWWKYDRELPYMVDYCFLPEQWSANARHVWFGGYDQYGAETPRSDHAPLLVDIPVAAMTCSAKHP